jgi:hypothetical protein
MQMDESDEQPAKAEASIAEHVEPDSKLTFESLLRPEKQPPHKHLISFRIISSATMPKQE